jgi:hypothetical protein
MSTTDFHYLNNLATIKSAIVAIRPVLRKNILI